ncbi:MAG: hypothetical protein AB1609_15435 [Bacillota bacterium]
MWWLGRAGHALVWLVIAVALHRVGLGARAAGEEVVQLRPPLRDEYVMSWTYGSPEPSLVDDLDGDALPDVVRVGRDHPNGMQVSIHFEDGWGISLRPDTPGRGRVPVTTIKMPGIDSWGELQAGWTAWVSVNDLTGDEWPEVILAVVAPSTDTESGLLVWQYRARHDVWFPKDLELVAYAVGYRFTLMEQEIRVVGRDGRERRHVWNGEWFQPDR